MRLLTNCSQLHTASIFCIIIHVLGGRPGSQLELQLPYIIYNPGCPGKQKSLDQRPGQAEALGPDPLERLLACQRRLLEFDLDRDPVDFEVARLGKGNVVLFPFLPEPFGHQFFKDLAAIVD